MGYVYVIGSETFRWYKIGKANNPILRVTDLGILLPFKIELFAIWQAKDALGLERLLHEKYQANAINGEWFKFSPAELRAVVYDNTLAPVRAFSAFGLSALSFTNLERDCPKGKYIRVSVKTDPDSPTGIRGKARSMLRGAIRKVHKRLPTGYQHRLADSLSAEMRIGN